MKLLGLKRMRPQASVSVDSIIAQIGGTDEELLRRFAEVGRDFMDRPQISYDDAKQAYAEWQLQQNHDASFYSRYETYRDDRNRRRRAAAEQARAEARAVFVGPHQGGQEMQRYLQAQWIAERPVIAAFDATEPELTITAYREWERQQNA